VGAWLYRHADPNALRERRELGVEGSEGAWHALTAAFAAREPDAEDRLASRETLAPGSAPSAQ
jgi:hypothetical protein